jgi:DNA-binding transcriptional regulator YdaS (Cro superfamily)
MDLFTYVSDMAARKQLAEACGTSPAYLWQIATRWRGRRASIELAKTIETSTQGVVTCRELRPDVFALIES